MSIKLLDIPGFLRWQVLPWGARSSDKKFPDRVALILFADHDFPGRKKSANELGAGIMLKTVLKARSSYGIIRPSC